MFGKNVHNYFFNLDLQRVIFCGAALKVYKTILTRTLLLFFFSFEVQLIKVGFLTKLLYMHISKKELRKLSVDDNKNFPFIMVQILPKTTCT